MHGYPAAAFFDYNEHLRTGGKARVLTKEEIDAIKYALPTATEMLRKLGKKPVKCYSYHSGSKYESCRKVRTEDGKGEVSVSKLRAVRPRRLTCFLLLRCRFEASGGMSSRIRELNIAWQSKAGSARARSSMYRLQLTT